MFLAAPGDVLTKGIRQELLDQLDVPSKDYLQTKLNNNQMGAFDGGLLDYMTNRAGQSFFWNTGDVAGIKSFINTNLATSSLMLGGPYLTRSTCSNSSSTGVARPKIDTDTFTRPRSKSSSSTTPLKLAKGPSSTLTASPIS